MKKVAAILFSMTILISTNANAWFFFWIPLPSGGKSNSTSPAVPTSNMPNGGQAQQLNNIKPTEIPSFPVTQPAIQQPSTSLEPTPTITAIKPEKKIELVDLNPGQNVATRKLIELKSLLDKGLITQKDYDSKKTEILKSM